MSKRVQQLLLAVALTSSAFAFGASHGTYLTVIPGDSEMRSLVAAKTLGAVEGEEEKTSSVALRLVYSKTWDSANLGTYFAPAGDNNNVVNMSVAPSATTDVDLSDILRNSADGTSYALSTAAASSITFLPTSTRMAVNLSYCQDLKSVMEGAWFDLNVSLARVKNDLHAVIVAGAKGNATGTIDQFFNGTALIASTTPASAGLNAGKITATAPDAVTGPEQVQVRLGYNFVNNDTASFGAFVSGVAGLGAERKLENLFESAVGHRNMGLGLGVQGTVSLSKSEDYEMQLNVNAAGHYMFARQDYRLGQITGQTGVPANWTHYYFAKDTVNTLYAPVANYLKRKVNVAPRYNADLGAQFVYVGDCVGMDLGYAMHYQAKEENTLVDAFVDTQFVTASTITDLSYVGGTKGAIAVKAANLNYSEDSQLLHTIHGGVSYSCKDMENPVLLGLGGSVSLANDRTRSEQHWSVFAKLGVSF